MKIKVKAARGGDKYEFKVDKSQQVDELKKQITGASKIPPEEQRLIYKGRVLKDDQTMEDLKIKENDTILLVRGRKKAPNVQAAPTPTPATNTTSTPASGPSAAPNGTAGATAGATPNGTASTGTGAGTTPPPMQNPFAAMGGMGAGMGGMGGMPNMQAMQQQMMQNPEMMQQMMNSPFVQSIMNNPEALRGIIMANPQMRQLVENNPHIGHILNDPNTLRQAMQTASNPALMREMMRNTDRSMANISTHPEGFNALRRFYHNVQEPMMDAASNQGNSSSTPSTA